MRVEWRERAGRVLAEQLIAVRMGARADARLERDVRVSKGSVDQGHLVDAGKEAERAFRRESGVRQTDERRRRNVRVVLSRQRTSLTRSTKRMGHSFFLSFSMFVFDV